jgi:hypothetical protein
MKRAAVILSVALTAVLLVLGLDELSDLTQTRPDHVDETVATVVELEVRARNYDGPLIEAARAQWAACEGTIGGTTQPPGLEETAEGRFRATIVPGIGPRGRQRLEGCLADAVVDRVLSRPVSFETVPAPDPPGPPDPN